MIKVKYVQARWTELRLGSTYQGVTSPSQLISFHFGWYLQSLCTIGYIISVIYCATCHATLADALPYYIQERLLLLCIVTADRGIVIIDTES